MRLFPFFFSGHKEAPARKPSGPLNLSNKSNITISDIEINNINGVGIYILNCKNITIRNIKLYNTTSYGIYIQNSSNITVEYSDIGYNHACIYALSSTEIHAKHNNFNTPKGPAPRGQFFQLNQCYGYNSFTNNYGKNVYGDGDPEDCVSLFRCNGTKEKPILIADNFLTGGGPSRSGGGIMTGDYGGSYQLVTRNTLVDPGQYGIGVAGGHDIVIENNIVVAKQNFFTNVGIYAWDQSPSKDCRDVTIKNNKVKWINSKGSSNPFWNGGNVDNLVVQGNDFNYTGTIDDKNFRTSP